jgi:hypothetical protein
MRPVIFCAAVFLATASNAAELVDHSSSKVTLHFDGAGPHTPEVRTIVGVITIEAYDGSNVEMVVDKTIVADDQEDIAAAKREVVLETRDSASTVGAVARYPHQGTCGRNTGGPVTIGGPITLCVTTSRLESRALHAWLSVRSMRGTCR